MNTYAKLIAAVAAVLVVALGAYQFLPGGSGFGGTNATPMPSPALLARGAFVEHDYGRVEIDATRTGSSVTGQMTIGEGEGAGWPLTVDLQCARTTEDGVIMIGGALTADGALAWHRKGTLAWVGFERVWPDRATVGVGSGGNLLPATQTTDCLAYLDAWLEHYREWPTGVSLFYPFEGQGAVEFGP